MSNITESSKSSLYTEELMIGAHLYTMVSPLLHTAIIIVVLLPAGMQ